MQNATLPVMERFYTIQGEGKNQGKAAWFIRLAGCDVGCVWCDVKESWEESKHPVVLISDLVAEAVQSGTPNVVITGGEPLLHDLWQITKELKEAGLEIWLETSGSSPLTGYFDWICVSPKKFKAPLPEVLNQSHEFKAVVFHKSDFEWVNTFIPNLNPSCELFLQPEWSKKNEITPLIVEYVKTNPKWRLSLQSHKYIDIP